MVDFMVLNLGLIWKFKKHIEVIIRSIIGLLHPLGFDDKELQFDF